MFEITSTRVYGLEESLAAAALPKDTCKVSKIFDAVALDNHYEEDNIKRGRRLGRVPIGSGHDCFLKGIVVQMNIRYPQYFSLQFQRYHFHDIISSQSKMHKMINFDIDEQCNHYTDKRAVAILKEYIERYRFAIDERDKNHIFKQILANTPMGFELTMRVSTNYLQLKTIYFQRVNSDAKRMDEWKIFCEWCENLPYFKEFILKGE
jgi:hypothetical protein